MKKITYIQKTKIAKFPGGDDNGGGGMTTGGGGTGSGDGEDGGK